MPGSPLKKEPFYIERDEEKRREFDEELSSLPPDADIIYNEWNTNSAWFLEWLEWFLCPILAAGSVIILDNASFHKKTEVYRIVASYGCYAIFLPPYSPDKNKIEKSWANLKNWLRLNAKKFPDIRDAILACFKTE